MEHIYFENHEEYMNQAKRVFEGKTTPEQLKRIHEAWEIDIIMDYAEKMEKMAEILKKALSI